jgi:hypothetical protein
MPGAVSCKHVYEVTVASVNHSYGDCEQGAPPGHHHTSEQGTPLAAKNITKCYFGNNHVKLNIIKCQISN